MEDTTYSVQIYRAYGEFCASWALEKENGTGFVGKEEPKVIQALSGIIQQHGRIEDKIILTNNFQPRDHGEFKLDSITTRRILTGVKEQLPDYNLEIKVGE